MTDEPKPVVLVIVPNPYIAEVLVRILGDEGIAAFVEGENLEDAFAASQRVLGNLSTRVFVHEHQVDEARRVLAEARAAGHVLDEEAGNDGGGGAGS